MAPELKNESYHLPFSIDFLCQITPTVIVSKMIMILFLDGQSDIAELVNQLLFELTVYKLSKAENKRDILLFLSECYTRAVKSTNNTSKVCQ